MHAYIVPRLYQPTLLLPKILCLFPTPSTLSNSSDPSLFLWVPLFFPFLIFSVHHSISASTILTIWVRMYRVVSLYIMFSTSIHTATWDNVFLWLSSILCNCSSYGYVNIYFFLQGVWNGSIFGILWIVLQYTRGACTYFISFGYIQSHGTAGSCFFYF